MNKNFISFGIGILLFCEVVFYFLVKTISDFDKIISSQKELLEIFGLVIVIISGKLILDGISYIKESNIKNLKETMSLITDYDKNIDIILDSLEEFNGKDSSKTYLKSISIPKIIIFLNTLEGVMNNSLNETHKKLFINYINHIYFKIYLHLLKKKYLKIGEDGVIVEFVGSVKSQILHQVEPFVLDKFLEKIRSFKGNQV